MSHPAWISCPIPIQAVKAQGQAGARGLVIYMTFWDFSFFIGKMRIIAGPPCKFIRGGVKRDCSKHNTCKSSLFCQVQVFATPWTVAHQAPLSMEFSRQESWTGLGNHSLLQGIFPIQGSNPGLLHCRWILYCLSRQRSPGWYLVCSQHTINVSRGNAVSLVNDDAPALSQSP